MLKILKKINTKKKQIIFFQKILINSFFSSIMKMAQVMCQLLGKTVEPNSPNYFKINVLFFKLFFFGKNVWQSSIV